MRKERTKTKEGGIAKGDGRVKRREGGDHNEGMRVCRAVRRCLLDSQRHARWVNRRMGTEMDVQPEGGPMYVPARCYGTAPDCVHCVHGALTEGKTNSGRERGSVTLPWQPIAVDTIDSTYKRPCTLFIPAPMRKKRSG